MPEEKVDWRIRVADAAETIYKEASDLKDFLSLFFGFGAARLPQVRPVASVVETVIERLSVIMDTALTIVQEVSKEKVDWEKIKEVFPTRAWLASIEAALHHLDLNPKFRGIMPFYSGRLREDFAENIEAKLQQILDIFVRELGLEEIGEKYTEELKPEPPTEEELEQEYEAATGKKMLQPEELKSLFNEISKILMRELRENPTFPGYWQDIAQQFESALDAKDTQKLRDIHRQIVHIYDRWIAPKVEELNEKERKMFEQFFGAMKDYILRLKKSNLLLLKFKLTRRLLGLE
jgi:truncated hemoglobin YjbI